MGKAAIYNPYLDTLGGGERYTFSFAKVLAEEGYDVDIEWKNQKLREKIIERFGLKLSENIKFVDNINRGDGYDICFWVSDGSIPTLRARNNYIHFQVPFKDVNGKSLINKMKLFRVKGIICNSLFTKKMIDKEYGVSSVVVYPPIDVKFFKPKRKENTILYVGRFSDLVQNKGHEILIKAFKKMRLDNWKLVLAGGIEVGAPEYLKKLKIQAKGFNIEFIESPSFDQIIDIYGRSKIFWSATGFDVDENKNPEKVEHFGISLIEAMSAGCVPIVYKAGGYKEIIDNENCGFLWENLDELITLTKQIMTDYTKLREISQKSQLKSQNYSYEEFKKSINNII
ncbi:hypothetical protein A2130_02340 [Candidatus Woesebacteria bacterium GWC2_33_12]|uniref:Glycosyl transferase family 1 domain-containing protein n=1 Tax=Candidatus Woesebacteria bacterium GW2011_GWB1_33_22 TaxID=1618566 RepID=A0A0G0C2P9_9BACT|nr:MAG: hypothetical protein UR29_C0006G0007 [Candidatus Woesebacteria bacterium GW2011_GWC2_33_12]KKP42796.1 MAG: hypothetical protein UR33_C0001G0157 [Candidatus Woesebacteria bacterium GW2011_GWA2_33_20]KKP45430.1 MAG: hypothetical protein UR35_C0001G0027 [Candidatus Woesebacteria bacterium GW2011_GWB1_33_22]KKP46271.1 MAG: hypothetical protein UR37_C0010G0027 [Microgenomates group bacterium GW2011_GWC1_33_28]KKP50380.1 MAG: hypothetical protein UR41_C0009G0027 [Candidatus Woesebacteria bact